MKKAIFLFYSMFALLSLVRLPYSYGQIIEEDNKKNFQQEDNERTESAALPQGFSGIMLQDTKEDVLKTLENHAFFYSPDEPNITLLPSSKEQIIEVVGKRFVRKALMQFDSKLKLAVITLYLDTNVVDYFSVYTTHEKKYGRAQKISPEFAIWQGNNVMILLEKPLQVKYVYVESTRASHSSFVGEQKAKVRSKARDEFLSFF